VISSKPVMPVGALVGALKREDRADFISLLFPRNDDGSRQPTLRRIGCRSLERLFPMPDFRIDTSAGCIQRGGRKRQNLNCSRARTASSRNMEWSWRQITGKHRGKCAEVRQPRPCKRDARMKSSNSNRLGPEKGRDSYADSIRVFTAAVCTVGHTSRHRAPLTRRSLIRIATFDTIQTATRLHV
jgi:hypothetical protein